MCLRTVILLYKFKCAECCRTNKCFSWICSNRSWINCSLFAPSSARSFQRIRITFNANSPVRLELVFAEQNGDVVLVIKITSMCAYIRLRGKNADQI